MNNVQKKFKNQNGSIALFTLVSLVFLLAVVMGVAISLKNKETNIERQYINVKNGYEKNVGQESTIYAEKNS